MVMLALFLVFFSIMVLTANNITHAFGKKQVLKQVSFRIEKGEAVVLVGPSGSGKTTLFHLIAGFYPLQSGEISIQGFSPSKGKEFLSYMLQEDLLLPWRSVLENVLLLPELRYKEKDSWREKAKNLLCKMGLEEELNSYPHKLSGGMKQRVSLARALLLDPVLLLLDEPFAAIDPYRKESLFALLRQMQKEREMSLFFITHTQADAKELGDRSYTLVDGEITSSL